MKKTLLASLLTLVAFAMCAGEKPETRFAGERTTVLRDGRKLEFRTCVAEQLRAHPSARAEDVLKQCFQGAYGPGHVAGRRAEAERRFDAEYAAVAPRPEEPLFEVISPDFMRVNLGAWKMRGLPPKWLFNMFFASARRFDDGDALFARYLAEAEDALPPGLRAEFGRKKRELSGGVPRHSGAYRSAERPSYRLVSTRFIHALPVLQRAAALPEAGKAVRVIAIDGRAASGKTTLARQLALITGAETVHMDDFFLPAELRTAERYREPGGNIHYERFAEEALPRLRDPRGFSYRVFDCSAMDYGGTAEVKPSAWRIVEGAYALHPVFGEYADLKIFCDIAPEEQKRRIVLRNGADRYGMFAARWIPLEERYIEHFDIKRRADLILGGRRSASAGDADGGTDARNRGRLKPPRRLPGSARR